MDQSYITFDVRCTSASHPVGVEVKLNDTVIYANESFNSTKSICVDLPGDDDVHSLKIILKNKTANHTVLDPLGAIVQDANLLIENVCFDNMPAGHNILQLACYTHDCNGTDQLKEYKFYGEMGCNGTVELKFSTPIYVWLLEYM